MSGLIRIFSDLHYGDRSSRLRRLDQLSPLLDGISRLILNGDTLDTACDHYHLYDTDFSIMASLGVRNYRLSIAWPRILPVLIRTSFRQI